MRDQPLSLNVPWGKNQRGAAPLDTPQGDKEPLDPEEKEKPRENGALRDEKT